MNLKKIILTTILIACIISCNDDDSVTCTSCNSPQTSPFEVCKESNGNASVNGEDTGTRYDIYVEGLVEAGATCGN